MTFETIEAGSRLRISDAISEQIEKLIVEGALSPGDALPSERELAKRLGVSRPSLREALLKLEARGLIQVRRRGGFAIADMAAPMVTDPLAHLLNRHAKATDDVIELRQALECTTNYYAALRATTADINKLDKTLCALSRPGARGDSLLGAERDVEFHLALAEASHNVAIVHVMRGILSLMRRTIQHSRAAVRQRHGDLSLIHEQHRAILEAVRGGDPVAATDATRTHLNYVQTSMRQDKPERQDRLEGSVADQTAQ